MKKIAYGVVLIIVAACTKEVHIDIPGYVQQLVIDGNIETGGPPFVVLSTTQDIYSPTDLNSLYNSFVSGATVIVSDGTTTVQLDEICSDNLPPGYEDLAASYFGIPADQLANYHLCAYTSFNPAIWGQVGRTYALTVDYDGKEYTASTQIVQPVALDSVYWKSEASAPGFGYSWAILSDPAAGFNAYYWESKRINHQPNGNTLDPGYTHAYSPVFDDDFINGKTFEFAYENPNAYGDSIPDDEQGYYAQGDSVVIKFSSIDRDVYEFLNKKFTQLQSNGNPFASPVYIPTNISGGAIGIWAGFSPVYDTLYCVE